MFLRVPVDLPGCPPWVAATGRLIEPVLPMVSSGSCGELAVLRQRRLELPARGYVELREHVAQVPLGRACADEQLRADLRVRQALTREPGDLLLLRRELLACAKRALPGLLACRQQLAAGALGERLHANRRELLIGGPQPFARIEPSALPAQPLPVDQMRAGQIRTQPCTP